MAVHEIACYKVENHVVLGFRAFQMNKSVNQGHRARACAQQCSQPKQQDSTLITGG